MKHRDKCKAQMPTSADALRRQDELDMARFDDESGAIGRIESCMGRCPIAKRINGQIR